MWKRNLTTSNSKEKASYEDRTEYYDKLVPDELHERWKKEGFFNGLAVSPGETWRVPELDGFFLVCVEWDQMEGFHVLFPGTTVEEVAKQEYVEWHPDAKEKGHLWFYSPFPLVKKEPDTILGLEAKSEHERGIMISAPSVHMGGHTFHPVGIDHIAKWNEDQVLNLVKRIVDACQEHGVEYLDDGSKIKEKERHQTNHGKKNQNFDFDDFDAGFMNKDDEDGPLKLRIQKMIAVFPVEIDKSIRIEDGKRHNILLFTANSLLSRHWRLVSHGKLRATF